MLEDRIKIIYDNHQCLQSESWGDYREERFLRVNDGIYPSYLDDDEYDSPPIILAPLPEKMKTTYRTTESDSIVANCSGRDLNPGSSP